MLQHDERKTPISKLSHSKASKTQQVDGFTNLKKTRDSLSATKRDITIVTTTTLLA